MQKVKIKFYPLVDDNLLKFNCDKTVIDYYCMRRQHIIILPYLTECGFVAVQDKNCNIENITYTVEENSIKQFWTIFPQDGKKYCNFTIELIG